MANQSIIEGMAADFFETWKADGKVIVSWDELEPRDRDRFVNAMLEAVKRVPDRCELKRGKVSSTIILGEGRQAILDEHGERRR